MRPAVILTILVAAVVATSDGAGAAARGCKATATQEQLDTSPRAVLYRTGSGGLVGCLKNSGRRTEIAKRAPEAAFAALEGRFVAYESIDSYKLTITDLRTGEPGPAVPSFQGRRPMPGAEPSIVRVAIGNVRQSAWAVVNPRADRNEIYASRGRQTFCLDSGPGVDLDTLRLKDGSITWYENDRLRLVRLRTPGLRDVDCSR